MKVGNILIRKKDHKIFTLTKSIDVLKDIISKQLETKLHIKVPVIYGDLQKLEGFEAKSDDGETVFISPFNKDEFILYNNEEPVSGDMYINKYTNEVFTEINKFVDSSNKSSVRYSRLQREDGHIFDVSSKSLKEDYMDYEDTSGENKKYSCRQTTKTYTEVGRIYKKDKSIMSIVITDNTKRKFLSVDELKDNFIVIGEKRKFSFEEEVLNKIEIIKNESLNISDECIINAVDNFIKDRCTEIIVDILTKASKLEKYVLFYINNSFIDLLNEVYINQENKLVNNNETMKRIANLVDTNFLEIGMSTTERKHDIFVNVSTPKLIEYFNK